MLGIMMLFRLEKPMIDSYGVKRVKSRALKRQEVFNGIWRRHSKFFVNDSGIMLVDFLLRCIWSKCVSLFASIKLNPMNLYIRCSYNRRCFEWTRGRYISWDRDCLETHRRCTIIIVIVVANFTTTATATATIKTRWGFFFLYSNWPIAIDATTNQRRW